MKKGLGVTFVLLRYENGVPVSILGYITLKATSLISMGENEWEGSPAVEIAELAVRNGEEGRGYGSLLLKAGIVLANKLKENFIGVRYVTVCADHKAVGFYKKVVDFNLAEHHYKLPREQWNMTCVPMYIQLTTG
jgi:ribosomal protein S18 acetylase RimI-like enzyme